MKYQRITLENISKIRDTYLEGNSTPEVSALLGISEGSVQRVVKELGISRPLSEATKLALTRGRGVLTEQGKRSKQEKLKKRKYKKGPDHYLYKAETIREGTCFYCEELFKLSSHQIFCLNHNEDGKYKVFCSAKCHNQFQKEEIGYGVFNCLFCNEEVEVKKGMLKRRKFCSGKCAALHQLKYGNRVYGVETSIEKTMREMLEKNKIEFETQKDIKGTNTIPDFFIKPDICIYCDGDYYHSSDKAKLKDMKLSNELMDLGYRVIRFPGSQINWNIGRVEDTLFEFINEPKYTFKNIPLNLLKKDKDMFSGSTVIAFPFPKNREPLLVKIQEQPKSPIEEELVTV